MLTDGFSLCFIRSCRAAKKAAFTRLGLYCSPAEREAGCFCCEKCASSSFLWGGIRTQRRVLREGGPALPRGGKGAVMGVFGAFSRAVSYKESIKPQHIGLAPPRALAVPAQACFYPFPLF